MKKIKALAEGLYEKNTAAATHSDFAASFR